MIKKKAITIEEKKLLLELLIQKWDKSNLSLLHLIGTLFNGANIVDMYDVDDEELYNLLLK